MKWLDAKGLLKSDLKKNIVDFEKGTVPLRFVILINTLFKLRENKLLNPEKVEAPKVEASKVEAPKVDAPKHKYITKRRPKAILNAKETLKLKKKEADVIAFLGESTYKAEEISKDIPKGTIVHLGMKSKEGVGYKHKIRVFTDEGPEDYKLKIDFMGFHLEDKDGNVSFFPDFEALQAGLDLTSLTPYKPEKPTLKG